MRVNVEFLSKQRAIELWDKGIIDKFEVGTYKGLQEIHKYLFQDVFEFTGSTRDVNIAKSNFKFTNILFLESNLAIIEKMPESTFEEIIEKYVEMNIAHPFRDGNGRATRIWLDLILKKNLEQYINWARVDKYEYLSAMERSPINDLEIRTLLKNALTYKIYSRQVYMRGIQNSYLYENQNDYDIEEIDKEKNIY